ncbi:nitroreductase family protein [uncultured Desulfuromonas sp.]|uniref:nitroreductase family protein n=1 Tax=uncultured Desulfuromonas sp. TaxID=181013 RepID=UPI002AAAFA4E|nr:nitroreductase family protein [uncultured Desulfuromonas sp.]
MMPKFIVDKGTCSQCGLCAKDCVANIIDLDSGWPRIPKEKEMACLKCQHCLAICPTAAVSILGKSPSHSTLLQGAFPDPDQLEILIKGRRSVRHYTDENIESGLLQRLLDVACQAPTGENTRQVQLSVIDDKHMMDKFRQHTYDVIEKLANEGKLPEQRKVFANFVYLWRKKKIDVLFRGAPHLLVASVPRNMCSPVHDCVIALSYFELFAQSLGVGTVWDGLVRYAIDELLPGARTKLGIPEEHLIGAAMAFGYPAVHYQRTVENDHSNIVRCPVLL